MWILFYICLFYLHVSGYGDALESVDSITGGDVIIPCSYSKGRYKLVRLYGKDLNAKEKAKPIITVDFRKRIPEQHPNEGYEDRAVLFNAENYEPKFRLSNILPEDEGIYECTITPYKGQTALRTTKLNVIVLPTAMRIVDKNGQKVDSKYGPIDEGQNITLICEVIGGRPKPKIYWYEDKKILKSTWKTDNDSLISLGRVNIGPLNRTHTSSRFKCETTNFEEKRLSLPPIQIDINLKPNDVKFLTKESPLIADKTYEIECIAKGGKPPALIEWKLNDLPLTITDYYILEDNETSVSTVTFTPKDTDGGKILSCHAKSPKIKHQPLVASRNLTIHFSPKVSLKFNPNNTVNEGNPVTLTCLAESNPPPREIAFFKSGVKLKSKRNKMIIESAHRTSAGMYSCVATNIVSDNTIKESRDGQSKPVFLYVNHSPRCKQSRTIIGAGRQETVNITCGIHSWPDVDVYSWQFNMSGKVVSLSNKMVINKKSPTIAYTPKSDSDFGDLLCWAQNVIGKMEKPCIYEVIKAELPDRLENCSQVNATSTSIYVNCTAGRDGGLRQRFIGELFDITQLIHVQNVTENRSDFYFDDLSPGTMFFLKLFSKNDKGPSEKVVLQVNTSSLPDIAGIVIPSLQTFPITSILGVLIGIVAALVLVAVLITVVIRIKESGQKPQEQHVPLRATPKPTDPPRPVSGAQGIPQKLKNANLFETARLDRNDEKYSQKEIEDPEVHYAELTFKNTKKSKQKNPGKKKKSTNGKLLSDDHTLYATIDYVKTEQNKNNMKPKVPEKSKKSPGKSVGKKKNMAPQPQKSLSDHLLPLQKPPSVIQAKPSDQDKPSGKSSITKPTVSGHSNNPLNESPPKHILVVKPEIPPKPKLIEPPKRKKTVETQTSDEEETENSPLMSPTLESNL